MKGILRNWRWISAWTAVGAAGMWSTVFLTGWLFLHSQWGEANGERRPADPGVLVPIAVLVGLLQGAVIGGLQAVLLSRRIAGLAWGWMFASVIGAGVTIGAGVFALATYGWFYVPHPAAGVALCIGCLVVGWTQALVLARRTRWAACWPFVKLGAAFVGIAALIPSTIGWEMAEEWLPRVAAIEAIFRPTNEWVVVLVLVVPPVLYGLLTALPLVGLFDEPRTVTARAA